LPIAVTNAGLGQGPNTFLRIAQPTVRTAAALRGLRDQLSATLIAAAQS
jgi:hypothetical protein